jgi:hypothetical protein
VPHRRGQCRPQHRHQAERDELGGRHFQRDPRILHRDAGPRTDERGNHRDDAAEQQSATHQPAQPEHRVPPVAAPHRIAADQYVGRQRLAQRIVVVPGHCFSPRSV